MTKQLPNIINEDVNQLHVQELYDTRSTEALMPDTLKAELNATRRRTRVELEEALRLEHCYEQPIKTAWIDGKIVVLDGALRTEVAQEYSKKTEEKVWVQLEHYGSMTSHEAFVFAQSCNRQHGVQLTAEQKRLLDYRLYLLNNCPCLSSTEMAKVFGVGKTTGSKIRTCVEWFKQHQPDIQDYMNQGDLVGALEHISFLLKTHFSLETEAGAIHSYNKLSEHITGKYKESSNVFDETGACAYELDEVFKTYSQETVRKALKKRRGELGIIVRSKDVNADAYLLAFGDSRDKGVDF